MPEWNAADYAANSAVQQTWARELIAQLHLRGDEHVLDVGCGDGKVTAEIARAVPTGSVTGIDASPEMIRFARKTFPPGKDSESGISGHGRAENQSCCLSSPLFPKGGEGRGEEAVVQIQIPAPQPSPRLGGARGKNAAVRHCLFQCGVALGGRSSGVFARRGGVSCVPADGWWFRAAARATRRTFLSRCARKCGSNAGANFSGSCQNRIFFTVRRIMKNGCRGSASKRTASGSSPKDAVYEGRDSFAAWLRTTWLPYIQRVPENLREEFIAAVTDRYLAKHPPDDDGRVHVRMVRLEIDAVKV